LAAWFFFFFLYKKCLAGFFIKMKTFASFGKKENLSSGLAVWRLGTLGRGQDRGASSGG
jgi:hypothetical protein